MPISLQEMASRWGHRSVCLVLTIEVYVVIKGLNWRQLERERMLFIWFLHHVLLRQMFWLELKDCKLETYLCCWIRRVSISIGAFYLVHCHLSASPCPLEYWGQESKPWLWLHYLLLWLKLLLLKTSTLLVVVNDPWTLATIIKATWVGCGSKKNGLSLTMVCRKGFKIVYPINVDIKNLVLFKTRSFNCCLAYAVIIS